MNCIYYQNDSLNTLPESEQEEHIKTCPLCAERAEFEDQILKEAGQLSSFKPDSDLWGKIETQMNSGTIGRKSNIFNIILKHKIGLSVAAGFIILLSMSAFYFFGNGSDKILSNAALVKVEITEQNYLDAIDDLEIQASDKMASMDTDLMLLYRDKLETIDRQINRCRQAIQTNPGNAHIRRYMLAALQDKKETLREILDI